MNVLKKLQPAFTLAGLLSAVFVFARHSPEWPALGFGFILVFILLSAMVSSDRAVMYFTALSAVVFTATTIFIQGHHPPGLWATLPPGLTAIVLAGLVGRHLVICHKELGESQRRLENEKQKTEEKLGSLMASQEKMSKTVAELFTLQMVSDTVNSTLEPDRLLHVVSDVIIGVMGVNTCSICIFEENPGGIRYFVTNEKQQDMTEDIKVRALKYLTGGQEEVMVQEISGYDPVTSITITPVIKNNIIMGVIITGHTKNNLFSREDLRFLKSICNQISLAIENAMLYEKLYRLANTDSLTGLHNRTYFQKNFDSIISGLPEKAFLAVAIMDIDDFKAINDTYGHDAGDRVLVGLSELVSGMIRKGDVFVRYGGEEFVLIMQNIAREKSLERLNQIREAIKNATFGCGGHQLRLTVSIGVSYLKNREDTRDSIIKKADLALYTAKEKGKDRVEVYN